MKFKLYVERLRNLIYSPEEVDMPELAKVVGMFLLDYEHWTDELGKPGIDICYTSKDIQTMLEDIATISVDDIARIMLYMGFELDFTNVPTWKMWKREEPISLRGE